jgi:hypothetical protein
MSPIRTRLHRLRDLGQSAWVDYLSRRRSTVSTVKKSQATMPAALGTQKLAPTRT